MGGGTGGWWRIGGQGSRNGGSLKETDVADGGGGEGGGRKGRRVDETVDADQKLELDSRATATLYIKGKVLSLDAIHKEHSSKTGSYA